MIENPTFHIVYLVEDELRHRESKKLLDIVKLIVELRPQQFVVLVGELCEDLDEALVNEVGIKKHRPLLRRLLTLQARSQRKAAAEETAPEEPEDGKSPDELAY